MQPEEKVLNQPTLKMYEKEKVRTLLKLYGYNPTSYLAMENDKRYFFSSSIHGVIAYTVVKHVAICAGDPICKEEDVPTFLNEFIRFCRQNSYEICFCYITKRLVESFKTAGFGITKCGEECMFELDRYSLEGHKASRLRQGLRKAERLGIRVFEYDPRVRHDTALEKEIMNVSGEWLDHKKSSELSFLLGTISLDAPCDRRYFVAVDNANAVQGFIVFSPFMGGMGYLADVTRRKCEAPFGVMEKLTIGAFFKMHGEGVKWGSLGLAPLYNVKDNENTGLLNNALNYMFEHCNMFYRFKSLYQYKNKYVPTSWEPRYLAYAPGVMTPRIAYALLKSLNSKGISDFLLKH